jgi:S1-C subfamily serine protease
MSRRIPLLALFLALFVTFAQAAPPPDFCVRVFVADKNGGGHSMGSGTLLTSTLIVTNWHVVRDGRRGDPVKVLFPNWSVSAGYVVLVDKEWDIAAILIPKVSVTPATFGKMPEKGDSLTVHGYGMGLPANSTGKLTDFQSPSREEPRDLIEITDALVRQGDSGGPILNTRGEYVGTLFGGGRDFTIGTHVDRVKIILGELLDGKEWFEYDLTTTKP